MINSTINYFNRLEPWKLTGIGLITGIALNYIIPKIATIALIIFRKISDTVQFLARSISNTTFVVNVRSIGCGECADEHRNHIE
ncbi:MAG: hypothetical protein ACXVHM_03095 [Methanobacterium sp.]